MYRRVDRAIAPVVRCRVLCRVAERFSPACGLSSGNGFSPVCRFFSSGGGDFGNGFSPVCRSFCSGGGDSRSSLCRFSQVCRFFSSGVGGDSRSSLRVERLDSRALLSVVGAESSDFLQSLMTNDIAHLDAAAAANKDALGSIYTLFLNLQGRVLNDAIIYRAPSSSSFVADGSYLIECDARRADTLRRHLTLHKVRRKVKIELVPTARVWAAFPAVENVISPFGRAKEMTPPPPVEDVNDIRLVDRSGAIFCNNHSAKIDAKKLPVSKDGEKSSSFDDGQSPAADRSATPTFSDVKVTAVRDPRLSALGFRILAPDGVAPGDMISDVFRAEKGEPNSKTTDASTTYHMLRYALGVPEGPVDLPATKCLPLEANADYLHGVSFHKGCYLGQELTARTHHTGVVRKRLLPLLIKCDGDHTNEQLFQNLANDQRETHTGEKSADDVEILDAKGQKVGKLRGAVKFREGIFLGLALLRLNETLSSPHLTVGQSKAYTYRPNWWPREMSKELLRHLQE